MDNCAQADVSVATSVGTGAGRFLAAALLDALQGGGELIAVTPARVPPTPARRGVDFTFAGFGSEPNEVICAGLGLRSEVVSAQLLRRSDPQAAHRFAGTEELERSLRSADRVVAMRWCAPSGPARPLALLLRPDRVVFLSAEDDDYFGLTSERTSRKGRSHAGPYPAE